MIELSVILLYTNVIVFNFHEEAYLVRYMVYDCFHAVAYFILHQ